jgi:regulator of protease activity HflC (stomatin/prohibitin superfamily)
VTGALAWLNDLMTWLGRWVPRLVLVKATEEGVLFGPGGSSRRISPRLFAYWPITHQLLRISTRRRSLEVAAQLHAGEALSVVVVWQVRDAVAAVQLNDPAAFLEDRTQAALCRAFALGRSNEDITEQMLNDLKTELAAYGVDVPSVDIVQRSWVLPLKNLNDYAQHETQTCFES